MATWFDMGELFCMLLGERVMGCKDSDATQQLDTTIKVVKQIFMAFSSKENVDASQKFSEITWQLGWDQTV